MNEIWIMSTEDGEVLTFDNEETAQSYAFKKLTKKRAVRNNYLSYCQDYIDNHPNDRPKSYYDFVAGLNCEDYDLIPQCVKILTKEDF